MISAPDLIEQVFEAYRFTPTDVLRSEAARIISNASTYHKAKYSDVALLTPILRLAAGQGCPFACLCLCLGRHMDVGYSGEQAVERIRRSLIASGKLPNLPVTE